MNLYQFHKLKIGDRICRCGYPDPYEYIIKKIITKYGCVIAVDPEHDDFTCTFYFKDIRLI